MSSRARTLFGEFVHGAIHLWWIFVIVMPLTAFGLYLAIDHSNANQQRSQDRANRQFRQAQIESNRKFRQAIEISSRQNAYSLNKIVCGFRGFIVPTLKSYEAAAKDPTLTPSARARNDKRIATTRGFLDTLVSVPSDFDCHGLPKKPPKP